MTPKLFFPALPPFPFCGPPVIARYDWRATRACRSGKVAEQKGEYTLYSDSQVADRILARKEATT
jgi:hypothetical protein